VFEGLGGEVVLHYDRRIEGGEVYLVDLLVESRLWLEDHASLVRGLKLRDVSDALCVTFPERNCSASSEGLVNLIGGDEREENSRHAGDGYRPAFLSHHSREGPKHWLLS
jgi:hypothetical protein